MTDPTCVGCGGEVPKSRSRNPRKWCSESCRVRAFAESNPDYRARNRDRKLAKSHQVTVDRHREPVACAMCGAMFHRRHANRIYCSDSCRWRSYSHARSTRIAGNRGVPYTFARVAERDEWTCLLCGVEVDRALRYPDPMSGSVDHRVPLSDGGVDCWTNVQLAHLDCNRKRGTKPLPESA